MPPNPSSRRAFTTAVICALCWSSLAIAGEWEGIEYQSLFKVLGSATYQDPADSTLNPDNLILELPRWNYNTQLRLDLRADAGPVQVVLKPRFAYDLNEWEWGPKEGDSESDDDFYLNEGHILFSIADELFLSYGRENLQWGPSYLFPASNPFVQDSGQNNPKREVPGLDYAKAVWVPNRTWTFSLISNVGEGEANIERTIDPQYDGFVSGIESEAEAQRQSIEEQYQAGLREINKLREQAPGTSGPIAKALDKQADELDAFAKEQRDAALAEVDRQTSDILQQASVERNTYNRDFERVHAFKTDYLTFQKYASVIVSYKESEEYDDIRRLRLGGYAGWTASEALLLYTEGAFSLRGDELYPVADEESPFGLRFAQTREEEDDFAATALIGGSYTLRDGTTFIVEYLHNGLGYSDSQARDYYSLRRQAADAQDDEEPYPSLGQITLAQAQDPGMRFIRQNYLLLQFQPNLANDYGMILRSTFNLDDESIQFIVIASYELGDRMQLFAILDQNFGDDNTEFTSLVDASYQLGFEFTW